MNKRNRKLLTFTALALAVVTLTAGLAQAEHL